MRRLGRRVHPPGYAPITWGSSPASHDVRAPRDQTPQLSPQQDDRCISQMAIYLELGTLSYMPGGYARGANFRELREETVRKGVRVTLRGRIWSVHRGQNGPNGTDLVP